MTKDSPEYGEEEQPDLAKSSSVRDHLRVIFRHKQAAILFFFLCLGAALTYMVITDDRYRSEAKILVRLGWENLSIDPAASVVEEVENFSQPQPVLLNTIIDILKSQSMAEAAVQRIGAQRILHPELVEESHKESAPATEVQPIPLWTDAVDEAKEYWASLRKNFQAKDQIDDETKAVIHLMDAFEAKVIGNTYIISLSYTSNDAHLSREVVEEYTRLYLTKHDLVYRNPESLSFLQEQERVAREKLQGIRTDFDGLRKQSGVLSAKTHLEFIEREVLELEKRIDEIQVETKVSAAKVEDLVERKARMPDRLITGETLSKDFSSMNSLRSQLYTLYGEEQSLLARFQENSESVRNIRRKISALLEKLNQEEPVDIRSESWGINQSRQAVDAALHSEETKLASLKAQAVGMQDRHARLTSKQTQMIDLSGRLTELEHSLHEQEALYERISGKLTQARMEQILQEKKISHISIVQPATLPIVPEDSRKTNVFLAALFAGAAGGIFLTFLLASMDHTFKGPEEVEEKLGLPVITVIPRMRSTGKLVKSDVTEVSP